MKANWEIFIIRNIKIPKNMKKPTCLLYIWQVGFFDLYKNYCLNDIAMLRGHFRSFYMCGNFKKRGVRGRKKVIELEI